MIETLVVGRNERNDTPRRSPQPSDRFRRPPLAFMNVVGGSRLAGTVVDFDEEEWDFWSAST